MYIYSTYSFIHIFTRISYEILQNPMKSYMFSHSCCSEFPASGSDLYKPSTFGLLSKLPHFSTKCVSKCNINTTSSLHLVAGNPWMLLQYFLSLSRFLFFLFLFLINSIFSICFDFLRFIYCAIFFSLHSFLLSSPSYLPSSSNLSSSLLLSPHPSSSPLTPPTSRAPTLSKNKSLVLWYIYIFFFRNFFYFSNFNRKKDVWFFFILEFNIYWKP